ncbi:13350_t:CDS:1, partial [Gigaspora rosea]
GSKYSTIGFMWTAITTLSQNCELDSMITDEIEAIDLNNLNTIFKEEEEDLVIDYDEAYEIETTIKGHKVKISNPVDYDELVEKVKYCLHLALEFYWKSPTEISLFATLLDPRCKKMEKLSE